jgi:hypothetical protein
MAHYFDDMFQRSLDVGTPRSSGMRRLRRSSTARSIGARSDFDASTNGADDDSHSITNSVIHDDADRVKEKEEANSHLHRYISDQLERYKGENGNGGHEDEYETRA